MENLKIGFDAKRAFYNRSGLGNYSRTLLSNLFSLYPNNSYFLYTPGKEFSLFPDVKLCKNVALKSPNTILSKLFPSLWRSFGVKDHILNDNIDIFHGLSHEIPFNMPKKVKTVVTIHDLIYLRYPKYFPWVDRKGYDLKFRYACKNADQIIAISEQTKEDICNFFNINPEKITVIYQDCNKIFKAPIINDNILKIQKKYALPENYFLFIGDLNPRKNCLKLLKAFSKLPKDFDISLLICGRGNQEKLLRNFVNKNGLQRKVLFPGFIENHDLPALYKSSRAFIYPSKFEGFGIPLLEAMNSGTPIITSNKKPFTEIVKDNAILIDPLDVDSILIGMTKILEDNSLRNRLIERNFELAKLFDDEKLTNELVKTYNKLILL